ncbi:hypothetical protein BJY01DRAFT_249306 [Aspergillus pseudoustus]|uniref:Uncharacterized protein n=1 Tax=Aspergillus pseudoustus TaxID=1810923 RepID=A0ABR4JPF6_9EURO
MKRRAPPPSPLDLALSSITNLRPNGAVGGVAPGHKPKKQTNHNPGPSTNSHPQANVISSSDASAYTNLNLNPYASAEAYAQSKRSADGTDRTEGERSYDETFQLGMARFWALKAQALKEPFVPASEGGGGGEAVGGGAGSSGDMGPSVEWITTSQIPLPPLSQSQSQSNRQPSAPLTPETTPLNNDAIAQILSVLKPSCPKSQAWVQAHHAAKVAQEQLRVKMREREGLRKQVLQKLRDKTLNALSNANASKEEVREVLEMLPAREEVNKGDGVADADLEMDKIVAGSGIPGALGNLDLGGDGAQQKQFVRVSEAHAKLQKVLREIEEMKRATGSLAGSDGGAGEEASVEEDGVDGEDECEYGSDDKESIENFSENEDEMDLVS